MKVLQNPVNTLAAVSYGLLEKIPSMISYEP